MNSEQIVEKIQRKLGTEKFHYTYDEKQDKLRLEHKELGKGLDISIAGVLSKYEGSNEIDEPSLFEMMNASSCNTVVSNLPLWSDKVIVDLPEPDKPNTLTTKSSLSFKLKRFCPP